MGISYEKECDSWFERNKNAFDENNCSKETQIIAEFLKRIKSEIVIHNVLEIGCSYGYNLQYLKNRFGFNCYGIDPSYKAIDFGNSRYGGGETLQRIL